MIHRRYRFPSTSRPHQRRTTRVSRRRFVAGLSGIASVLSLLGASACRLEVPPPPTPTQAPALVVHPDDLIVGVVLSLSGRFSREGNLMRAGYQTWLDAVQRAGGLRVGGDLRPVRLIYADDESEPLTAGQQVEKLVTGPGARLLLGPFSSPLTGAAAVTSERLGALLVAPDGSAPGLFRHGYKLFVSLKPTDTQTLLGLADIAATVVPRAQPIGVLLSDELPIVTEIDGFRERAAALGLDPIQVEPFSPGSNDLAAPLERLSQLDPRFLIVASNQAQIELLVARVEEELPPPPMRALIHLPETAGGPPSIHHDGALTVEIWSPRRALSGPVLGSASAFADQFRRLHGYVPTVYSAEAAAAGLALQLGVERAASPEPREVRRALGTLDVQTFWGRLAWDVDGRLLDPVVPVRQQQGTSDAIVYPPPLAMSRVQYPLTDWPRL